MISGRTKTLVAIAVMSATALLGFILISRHPFTQPRTEPTPQARKPLRPANVAPAANTVEKAANTDKTRQNRAVLGKRAGNPPERPSHARKALRAEAGVRLRDDPGMDLGPDTEFTSEEIRGMLASALEEDFPELDLTDEEMKRLTAAVMTIRESMRALKRTARTAENAEAMRQLRENRERAMRELERITGMSALTLMSRAPAEDGIDRD